MIQHTLELYRAEFILGNIKMNLHFLWFLNTKIVHLRGCELSIFGRTAHYNV